ncbi:DUF2380 domain-containing protein [Methylogaea oryzae]|uniref:DUF2380 domain-containing protein n=1 Tax=Methylogaea oryzae TaxID=1295382 RepID=A0A8D5AJN8_9GAMM|nr:DUF2380 domain-containing protein [Methylogaea oryzae]BBL70994.1 hypothetical protein MoryE10_16000 [Methylogaea oryzae]
MPLLKNPLGPVLALLLLVSLSAGADTPIAVLDFELHDITSNPGVAEEVRRTASLKPLLESSLSGKNGYRIVAVDADVQRAASHGFGYLWDHPDEAALLGKSLGSRFVIVGRVSKPSFLFVHFTARVVDVQTGRLVEEFVVEVKGQQQNFSGKGVENLARQIDAKLQTVARARPD